MLDAGEKLEADPRWEIIATGGSCTALSRSVVEGIPVKPPRTGHWLITQHGGADAPETMDEPVLLGLYDGNEGQAIGVWDCATVWAALAIANGMHR